MRWRRLLAIAVALSVCGRLLAVWGADDDKPSRADRRAVQMQLHARSAQQRAEAVRRLTELPAIEGAKLALQAGLADHEQEVRQAAYTTLLTWKENEEVSDFLLKSLERDSHGKGASMQVLPLAVLVSSDSNEIQQRLDKFFDAHLSSSKDGAAVVGAIADELGRQADPRSVATLKRLAAKKFVWDTFACRRAVIQALVEVRRPEAVAALVACLPKLDGEVRGDVVQFLEEISGQRNGLDAKAWQAWWKKHADGFEFPPKPLDRPGFDAVPNGVGSYYGFPLYARRIVFVIDISGSMAGPRITAAKRELTNAINGLPDEAELGIVAFHSRVFVWRANLTRANATGKQSAVQYAYQLTPGGHTATYDALEAAFRLDPEAIYLLSDGAPNAGRIPMAAAIVNAVGAMNRARRISIYCFGIAPGPPNSPMELFMKTLAEQNFGRYRRLDQ
jgi:hypothetical protein